MRSAEPSDGEQHRRAEARVGTAGRVRGRVQKRDGPGAEPRVRLLQPRTYVVSSGAVSGGPVGLYRGAETRSGAESRASQPSGALPPRVRRPRRRPGGVAARGAAAAGGLPPPAAGRHDQHPDGAPDPPPRPGGVESGQRVGVHGAGKAVMIPVERQRATWTYTEAEPCTYIAEGP